MLLRRRALTLNSGVLLPFNHRTENEIWKFERTYNLHTHISICMQMKWSCFCLFIRELDGRTIQSARGVPVMVADTVCECVCIASKLWYATDGITSNILIGFIDHGNQHSDNRVHLRKFSM